MPTYTYQCPSCKARREVIKSISRSDEAEHCAERGCRDGEGNEREMKKQLHAVGFSLKGRGWFRDGYTK